MDFSTDAWRFAAALLNAFMPVILLIAHHKFCNPAIHRRKTKRARRARRAR